jgi:hypothetical protein
MIADVIIQHSTSPWNSPILVVPKKPGASEKKTWRVVVDFHKLKVFYYPIISGMLNLQGNSKYFSTIDCASDFGKFQ